MLRTSDALDNLISRRNQLAHETEMFVKYMYLSCAYSRKGNAVKAAYFAGKASVFASGTNSVSKAFALHRALLSALGL